MEDLIFEQYESQVRAYCRSFPALFVKGKNAYLYDEEGRAYIDFFAGAGALNYGHNPDFIKQDLLEFIQADRVLHALDFYTNTKRELLIKIHEVLLQPRHLDYKIQFCGPTGANSVEAALKLARLYTGRAHICAFTGGWHGMTSGCLSVTGNKDNRLTAGFPLGLCHFLPYPVGPTAFPFSLEYIEALFSDPNSGIDKPAAIILETIQAEGGVYSAPIEWLKGIREICDRHHILLIIDDIQVGCGRSGPFFSFERAGIIPDIVCLSKSLSGYGLPMAVTLFKRELDIWKPGQHTGTFRGHQLAFMAATKALDYWKDPHFQEEVLRKGRLIQDYLTQEIMPLNAKILIRGLGLIWGVDLSLIGDEDLVRKVSKDCFKKGLIIERAGRNDTVLKLMPPLTIEDDLLKEGCRLLANVLKQYM